MATKKPTLVKPPVSPFGVISYRTDAYRALYANICQVTVGPSDIQILMGRGGQVTGETKVEEIGTLYLSPVQAKQLARVLTGQVQVFEKKYGVIPTSAIASKTAEDAPAPEGAAEKK